MNDKLADNVDHNVSGHVDSNIDNNTGENNDKVHGIVVTNAGDVVVDNMDFDIDDGDDEPLHSTNHLRMCQLARDARAIQSNVGVKSQDGVNEVSQQPCTTATNIITESHQTCILECSSESGTNKAITTTTIPTSMTSLAPTPVMEQMSEILSSTASCIFTCSASDPWPTPGQVHVPASGTLSAELIPSVNTASVGMLTASNLSPFDPLCLSLAYNETQDPHVGAEVHGGVDQPPSVSSMIGSDDWLQLESSCPTDV
ncbi:hypothetical protein BGZ94_007523 [Podila epigama]|nr:hypothetical protein BGZ94_007523 [Podila epigama]